MATSRRRILLSAYACEPKKGSEPGVGWEWATRLPHHHDVTVITRANNRQSIELALTEIPNSDKPNFIYYDLPRFFLDLKKRKIISASIYYLLWQVGVRCLMKPKLAEFSLIHHVTFNGFLFPGAWWSCEVPVILGPLGGSAITSSYFKSCFGKWWLLESLRGLSIRLWQWNPWTIHSLRSASAVFAVGEEMVSLLKKSNIAAEPMLETALPLGLEEEGNGPSPQQRMGFVWVGTLEPRKAWRITLESFAIASKSIHPCHRLAIIGGGKQVAASKEYAHQLGISDLVDFLGNQDREEVWRLMRMSRGLIFSSVRDTSGNVVLEAMGARCPVVCFKHQGVEMMTDDNCAYRIQPTDWDVSVAGFVEAIRSLAEDDEMVASMGNSGRMRVIQQFTWGKNIKRMIDVYETVIQDRESVRNVHSIPDCLVPK